MFINYNKIISININMSLIVAYTYYSYYTYDYNYICYIVAVHNDNHDNHPCGRPKGRIVALS